MRLSLRSAWRTAAVLGVTASLFTPASPSRALGTADAPAPQRLRLDVTGHEDLMTRVSHAALPPATGIGPGSRLFSTIPGEGTFLCTANFVWASGTERYLGAAGHCFLPDAKTATHGSGADYNASGVVVEVCTDLCVAGGLSSVVLDGTVATLGAVVYARQTQGGVDVGNDFGLVRIPPALHTRIRNGVPVFGGPTTSETLTIGEQVCMSGNGIVLGETFATQARTGVGVDATADWWQAILPVSGGDSGSAAVVCAPSTTSGELRGRGALGVVTHMTRVPPGAAGTTTAQAIQMAGQAGLSISLQTAS